MDQEFDRTIESICREHRVPPPRFVWDPTPDDVTVPHLARLLEHWHSLRGDDDLPHFQCVDPLDMGYALGHLNLLEVVDNGEDFRYRISSTEAGRRLGVEYQGMLVSEVGKFSSRFFGATYRESMRRRLPLYSIHVPPLEVSVSEWRRLLLPLAGDDGTVVRFLSGVHAGPWRPPA